MLVDSFIKLTSPKARRARLELRNPVTSSTKEFACKLFRREMWKATSAISMTRDAAIRAGMFAEDVKQRQDLEFLIRLTQCAKCGSIDDILWVKTWSANRITSRQRFLVCTLEIVRRYPQFHDLPHYRVGLARDLGRHMLLLIRDRDFGQVATDLRLAASEFGIWRTSALLTNGARELLVREARRRIRRPRASASIAAAEPAAARSRV